MAISVGEVEATLKLKDQMSAQLEAVNAVLEQTATKIEAVNTAGGKIGDLKPLPELVTGEQQAKLAAFEEKFKDVLSKTEEAPATFSQFGQGLITGAFATGVLGGTAALGGLALSAGTLASDLTNLSAESGVSTTELDRLARIGGPAGVSLDTIARSAQMLEKNIARGNDSVLSALGEMNIAFENMPRGEVFNEVIKKLAEIKDPAEQARLSVLALRNTDLVPMIKAMQDGAEATGGMTRSQIAGLDAAKSAIEQWKDTAIRDVGSTLGAFQSFDGFMDGILQRLGVWGQNILGAKQFFDELPSKLQAAAAAAGMGFQEGAPKGLEAFKSPELKLKGADEFAADMKKITDETERAVKAWEAHNKKIDEAGDILAGKDLPGKVRDLSDAMEDAEKKGGLAAYQFDLVAKQAQKLRDQGATLTPKLADMAHGLDILKFSSDNAKMAIEPAGKMLKQFTDYTVEGRPKVEEFNLKLGDMVHLAQTGFGPATLAAIEGFGTKVSQLPSPPVGPWHDFEIDVHDTLGRMELNVADTVAGMIGHWHGFKDAGDKIWADIEGGLQRIMGDLLYEFEHRFITGMLNALSSNTATFADAFKGLFGDGISAAGDAAGSGGAGGAAGGGGMFAKLGGAAGTTWAAAFGFAAIAGLVGWGLWKFFQPHSTGAQTPVVDPNTGQVIYDPNDPNNPTPGWDPGNPWVGGDMGNDGSSGGLPGYAEGTGGQFFDFGDGTPVMLHGQEKVVTRAEESAMRHDDEVHQEIVGLRRDMKVLLPLAIRDAVLLARK